MASRMKPAPRCRRPVAASVVISPSCSSAPADAVHRGPRQSERATSSLKVRPPEESAASSRRSVAARASTCNAVALIRSPRRARSRSLSSILSRPVSAPGRRLCFGAPVRPRRLPPAVSGGAAVARREALCRGSGARLTPQSSDGSATVRLGGFDAFSSAERAPPAPVSSWSGRDGMPPLGHEAPDAVRRLESP